MNVERVACIDCGAMILPSTAKANAGLCGRCVKVPESLRQKRRDFDHKVASGSLFTPTQQELNSARQPAELASSTTWKLEPDYYSMEPPETIEQAIDDAATKSSGNVFLISETGSRLNLSFTEKFGVCEYQKDDAGEYLYSRTTENLACQVALEFHVTQACPCCGVGMMWYPSRFHMPRELAFELFRQLVSGSAPAAVQWLDGGDISYTSQGRG